MAQAFIHPIDTIKTRLQVRATPGATHLHAPLPLQRSDNPTLHWEPLDLDKGNVAHLSWRSSWESLGLAVNVFAVLVCLG